MSEKIDGIFIQVPLGKGISLTEIKEMIITAQENDFRSFLLKEVHAKNTSCYGFLFGGIDEDAEPQIMNFLESVIGDKDLENEDGISRLVFSIHSWINC